MRSASLKHCVSFHSLPRVQRRIKQCPQDRLCLEQLRINWRMLVSAVLDFSVLILDIFVEIKTFLTSILNVVVMSY